jgi:hypothetical protein
VLVKAEPRTSTRRGQQSEDGEMKRIYKGEGLRLSVGVVGLGHWGPNLLRGLLEQPNVSVKYICDLNEVRLGAFANHYRVPRTQFRPDTRLDPGGQHVESHGGRYGRSAGGHPAH